MAATTFNPLAVARDLEAAGVERRQAEAHAEALRQAVTADRDELATKADLAVTEGRLDAKLTAIKAELAVAKAELAAVKWVLAFQAALILAIAARLFGIV